MAVRSDYEQRICPSDNHCADNISSHVAQSKKVEGRDTCIIRVDYKAQISKPIETYQIQGREKHPDRGNVHLSI